MLKALITTSIRSADSFPSSETKLFPFSIYRILLFPLALSQFQRLIFLDHPSGFLVGRTKHFMDAAIDIKDKGTTTTSSSSIQNLRPVDVPIGIVHIVNLSTDDSTLAVSVSVHIHFFNVHSLLNDGELYHGALAAGTRTAKHIMDDVDAGARSKRKIFCCRKREHFQQLCPQNSRQGLVYPYHSSYGLLIMMIAALPKIFSMNLTSFVGEFLTIYLK